MPLLINLYSHAKMGREIMRHRGAMALQVFDRQTISLWEAGYSTGVSVVAAMLTELADRSEERDHTLSFRTAGCGKSCEAYNAAVQEGVFDPDVLDSPRTVRRYPDKSNGATYREEPPLHAYAATVGISFTFGGAGPLVPFFSRSRQAGGDRGKGLSG